MAHAAAHIKKARGEIEPPPDLKALEKARERRRRSRERAERKRKLFTSKRQRAERESERSPTNGLLPPLSRVPRLFVERSVRRRAENTITVDRLQINFTMQSGLPLPHQPVVQNRRCLGVQDGRTAALISPRRRYGPRRLSHVSRVTLPPFCGGPGCPFACRFLAHAR
ncbi:hypothetical protein AAFF_G00108620 [Aldrovandia affinis]|uniref:Uncharacterized protein n=1 Tax=Aldrovandia affinis TaxID=143900 RepID=A0AAD7RTZ3_9TELE|nr:hypothetical protein AAFF_G00108620 [Aldrovandia affinis]